MTDEVGQVAAAPPVTTPQPAAPPAEAQPATPPESAPIPAQVEVAPPAEAASTAEAVAPAEPIQAEPQTPPEEEPVAQVTPPANVPNTPLVLLVLDGFGIAPISKGNAIAQAPTPNLDTYIQNYPATTILASGEAVGLPWAELGNSEVGHLNIGAGKVMYQSLPLINKSIGDGAFFENEAFIKAAAQVKEKESSLHITGLLSNSGIHGQLDHLLALLEFCKQQELTRVYLHLILDGRDAARDSSLQYLEQLQNKMTNTGVGEIASISGRFWAMDRDNRWDRVEKAYLAMAEGTSDKKSRDAKEAITKSHAASIFDEEFVPLVMTQADDSPIATVKDNDAVLFYNFRPDRARELTQAFTKKEFDKFSRPRQIQGLMFVAMTEYEKGIEAEVAFPPALAKTPLAKVIADAGLKQMHIAETEKYAHVTFFFNGGVENQFPGEERALIPSPKVTSYDEKPEMSAGEITEKLLQELEKGEQHVYIVNFANADMVGHTGNLSATKDAIGYLDTQIGRIVDATKAKGGVVAITADHGNAELKLDLQTGVISKEHTTDPVPFILIGQGWEGFSSWFPENSKPSQGSPQSIGILADVAPTILHILGMPTPDDMSGKSLIPQ